MNYIKFEDIKPGDYFVTEIGTWQDDNDESHADGMCYGLASSELTEEYDEFTNSTIPVIKCEKTILADGEATYDDSLGAVYSNKVRYMTEQEIEYFNSKFV